MLSTLVYTPGIKVPLDLPRADGLSGTDKPSVSVAIDAAGRLYGPLDDRFAKAE